MKKYYLLLLFIIPLYINAQDTDIWEEVKNQENKSQKEEIYTNSKSYLLNEALLNNMLKKATKSRNTIKNSDLELSFPNERGVFKKYKIAEASVMSKELQEQYPQIKSYIGMSSDNTIIRFSFSPFFGFKGILRSSNLEVAHISKQGSRYKVFSQKEWVNKQDPIECGVIENIDINTESTQQKSSSNGDFRIYRLAMATTAEYSQFVLNQAGTPSTATDAEKKAVVTAKINELMTDVNATFENDLALTMQLVANNDVLIFLDPATDGFSGNKFDILSQSFAVFNNNIPPSDYDIGHVIGQVGGGVAYVGTVCGSIKMRGVSAGSAKTIIHEMGHQFGAGHTFNDCSYDNISSSTAVEIDCGHTVMSYGLNDFGNIFHSVNILQIQNEIATHSCPTLTSSGNTPPIVNAGQDYVIPKSTPFLLEGTATDPDGTVLTYSWEQIDTGNAPPHPFPENVEGPVFRWLPSESPKRYFPNLENLLVGYSSNPVHEEVVPSTSRDLNFAFMVRDNDMQGGETSVDYMSLNVDDNAGPFLITSHNSASTWYAGQTKTITWDVANTDSGLVNTPLVDIYFSMDGGLTYLVNLASAVANNGSYDVVVPSGIATNHGRFMVKGHNNVFLDINNAPIAINEKPFLVSIDNAEQEKSLCLTSDGNSISYTFIYNSYFGFDDVVNFTANNLSGTNITFLPSSTNINGSVITMTIDNISVVNLGTNNLSITATSGAVSFTENLKLNVYNDSIDSLNLISPADGTAPLVHPFTFIWEDLGNANSYTIQIGTDTSFNNIVINETVTDNTFITEALNYNSTYYWRVKPFNSCVEGSFSQIYSFTTQQEGTYVPDDAFEQRLISLGFDSGTLDDYVPTFNIEQVKELTFQFGGVGISDLTGIEDMKYLERFEEYGNDNYVGDLNLENSKLLKSVYIQGTDLNSISVKGLTKLKYLGIQFNNFTEVNLNDNIELETFNCNHSNLSNLDFSNNVELKVLSIYNNDFTSLNIDNNTKLEILNLGYNDVTDLDVSNNLLLRELSLRKNEVSILDVTNNTLLEVIDCASNDIELLDFSNCPNLTSVQIRTNDLNYLDLRNGNNTAITFYDNRNNFDLACTFVDDAIWSTANWLDVAQNSTFVETEAECSALGVIEQELLNIAIYPNPANNIVSIQADKTITTVEIYTITGSKVQTIDNIASNTIDLPLQHLATGVYFLKIYGNQGVSVKRLIKN